jgi:hypothetical protein
LGLILIEGLMFFKYKSKYKFVAFVILFYLINFALLVKFDEPKLNTKWFNAVYIPLIFIYISTLFARLCKNYKYVSRIGITIFLAINLFAYYSYVQQTDSYSFIKWATKEIRTHSKGEYIDVYGLTPEPVYYLLWYNEKDPTLKEKYLSYFKWAKEKNAKVIYLITATAPLTNEKLESLKDRHGILGNYVLIAENKYGKKIYRIE